MKKIKTLFFLVLINLVIFVACSKKSDLIVMTGSKAEIITDYYKILRVDKINDIVEVDISFEKVNDMNHIKGVLNEREKELIQETMLIASIIKDSNKLNEMMKLKIIVEKYNYTISINNFDNKQKIEVYVACE